MKTSNVTTFLYKFIFPFLFLLLFSVYLLTDPGIIKLTGILKVLFNISLFVIIYVVVLHPLVLLKKLAIIENNKIEISNYFKRITVDKTEIESVKNYSFSIIYCMKLKNKTSFGKRIYFTPFYSDILKNLIAMGLVT
ncbi:MAG: hypothetical protein JW973_13090 [Bacteroidales bacterium]|nr:hypothetical protein [Bacteroidales bacterium]